MASLHLRGLVEAVARIYQNTAIRKAEMPAIMLPLTNIPSFLGVLSELEDIHHTVFSRSLHIMSGTLRRDIYATSTLSKDNAGLSE